MLHSLVNPAGLYDPTSYGYTHTARIPAGAEIVLVSGQYASDPSGAVVSPDFAAQVSRALQNLGRALEGHGMSLGHVAQLRTYVVGINFERLGVIAGSVREIWSDTPPTQTLLGVAGLATPEILFEVEALAVRGC